MSKKMVAKGCDEKGLVINDNSAEALISQAIAGKVSVETIERLLAMRTQLKQEAAKEAFDAAMSKFQGSCPTIKKEKAGATLTGGKVAYHYAPLESIVAQVKKYLQENGFSYLIKTEMTDSKVKVKCIVKHIAGHSEETEVEMPLATRTNVMNAPQVVASTVTYGKRYAFCNAFGILTGDDDTDGQADNCVDPKKTTKPSAVKISEAEIVPEKNEIPPKKGDVNPTNSASEALFGGEKPKPKTDAEKIASWIMAIKKEAQGKNLPIDDFNKILRDVGVPEMYSNKNFSKINDIHVLESIFEGIVKFGLRG